MAVYRSKYTGAEIDAKLDQVGQTKVEWGFIKGNLTEQTDLVEALDGKYVKPESGIPASDLSGDVQNAVELAETALQAAPVTSVNGQTGEVAIEIPSKVSELENDSAFVADESYVHTDTNFTEAEKEKLAGIEEEAQKNVNADWAATRGSAVIWNKPSKLSDFMNDTNFVSATTDALTNYFTKKEMNERLAQIPSFDIQVVSELPTSDISSRIIYLVRNEQTEGDNMFTEYINVNGAWEVLGRYTAGGAVVSVLPEKITHAKLVELKNAGKLAAGQQYQITDYELTVNPESRIPMRSAGHAFDIIVTAISSEEIFEAARATWHEGDDYFSDCRLEQWEIKYYIDAADKAYPLDFLPTNNGGKGVIYYMKDELGNEAPYDFKNMQYKRFKVTSVLGDTTHGFVGGYLGLSPESPVYQVECDADDYVWMYTFCRIEQIWSANVIIRTEYKDASIRGYGSYIDMNAVGNIIRPLGADRMYQWGSPYHYSPNNIVVIGHSSGNEFGYDCYDITVGDNIGNDDNVFHNNCSGMVLLGGSARSDFNGDYITGTGNLSDCTVGDRSTDIAIGGNDITIGSDSSSLSVSGKNIRIGSKCKDCTINGTSIRLGDNNSGNTINGDNITIGSSCTDNAIAGHNITIGSSCMNNTFIYACSFLTIGDGCGYNTAVEEILGSIVFATFGQTIGSFELWYYNTKLDYDSYITSDALKTINGESIVGEGDIVISGGGTSDYTQLTNKPKIEGVELSGNKTASDLGLAKSSDLAAKQDVIADLADIRSNASAGATAYQKPSTGVPKTDLATDVQTSLTKADTALQEHQSLANYYTKSEVDNLIVSTINASF